jgi:hypothetical protein
VSLIKEKSLSSDGEENELPEGVATDREVARWERCNKVAQRISDPMAMLGYGATRKDIAAMGGVTVATLRR